MSNVIISPFFKSHPVFKADQVLSDVHLNDMLQYLEQENNQTRSQLIGTGILSGFGYQKQENEASTNITINNGKGVTSSGQLIIQQKEAISFSNAVPYSSIDVAKEFPLLPEGSLVFALVPDDEHRTRDPEGMVSIKSRLDLHLDTGLVALQESVDIQIESCFITNCDERGIQRKFAIKFLLIQIPDTVALEPENHIYTTRRLERLVIEPSNNPKLPEAYANAISQGYITWLNFQVKHIYRHLTPLLADLEKTDDISDVVPGIESKLEEFIEDHPDMLQHFYDFLMDLGQTVEDIIELRNDLQDQIHSLTQFYPNHLILGPLKGINPKFNKHHFQPVQIDRQDQKQLLKLKMLCKRLGFMLDTFSIPEKTDSISITPTKSRKYTLSEAAIPFYYNQAQINQTWGGKPLMTEIPEANPLLFEHDDKDAFLVEGLIGMDKMLAIKALKKLRSDHHLPIGIVALRVSSTDHNKKVPLPQKVEPGHIDEFNFKEFIIEHPGLYHGSSVCKGGTLAVIFMAEPEATTGLVVATLVLPYLCCGRKQVAEPKPFVLNATDDQRATLTSQAIDITVLDNDEFDKESPIEVDFVYELKANDDLRQISTGKQMNIRALQNDQFDKGAPIEVDLLRDLQANNVDTKTLTAESIDIDVLKNDNIAPGPIELDFDKDN